MRREKKKSFNIVFHKLTTHRQKSIIAFFKKKISNDILEMHSKYWMLTVIVIVLHQVVCKKRFDFFSKIVSRK